VGYGLLLVRANIYIYMYTLMAGPPAVAMSVWVCVIHTYTHTHTHSLSLSLSHTHTQIGPCTHLWRDHRRLNGTTFSSSRYPSCQGTHLRVSAGRLSVPRIQILFFAAGCAWKLGIQIENLCVCILKKKRVQRRANTDAKYGLLYRLPYGQPGLV